ncbi:MAG: hypothetical protein Q4A58_04700 [Fusobacterium sp.]|uniref:hypothetical protein n=1 Tax=Fusobacterium sp. TaxID=68766 RepID=UPI0026DD90E0|nr:hypothetical protein [Fusobacterium sp.]MDO4690575.1 hypothetical protein [Fusobacterium sp.]
MKLDSKNLVLNLLGQDANLQINKKLLLTLGLELGIFTSYLIDQYKYFNGNNALREDDSFYATNFDIQLYTTMNEYQIKKCKKQGQELGIFKVNMEGIPLKTYYYLDFQKILEIIATEKSNFELAYENIFIEENAKEINSEIDIENLKKLTYQELRFYCKNNNIKYSGNATKKIDLINLIIKEKVPNLANTDFITVSCIPPTSECTIHSLTKNEELDKSSESIDYSLVSRNPAPIPRTNKPRINTCHARDHEIENLFHELDINYTDSNVESVHNILKLLNEDKELLKEYITTFYNQTIKNSFNIQNKSAFFSAKLKTPDEILIRKILSKKNLKLEEEKKKIEKLKEIELIEEKKKKEEEQRIEADLIIKKLNELSPEKQEKILNTAEKKLVKKIPDFAVSLNIFKENSKITYYRMLAKNIKEVFYEEGIAL